MAVSEWALRYAEDARSKQQSDERYRDLQLHKATLVKGMIPSLWRDILKQLEIDAQACGLQFEPQPPLRKAVFVRRRGFPGIALTAELNPDGQSIDLSYSRTESFGAEPIWTYPSLKFKVNHEDDVYLRSDKGEEFWTAVEVANYLIAPLIR